MRDYYVDVKDGQNIIHPNDTIKTRKRYPPKT